MRAWALLLVVLCGCDESPSRGDGPGGDRARSDGGPITDGPRPERVTPSDARPDQRPDRRADIVVVNYGAELFVAPGGKDTNPGTQAAPFATLEAARTAVRALKKAGLPANGVVVWLRGGVHLRGATFTLGLEDSGEAGKPVVYRGYPGETARIVGGKVIDPSWLTAVTSASPVWARVDPAARGQLLQVDLGAHGITDHGKLEPRGFYATKPAALELFFNGAPMTLGRWPDATANEPQATFTDDPIAIYGDPSPDVTGSYVRSGTQDGVNAYSRQGLVGGKPYNLHRHTWTYQGSKNTAWFLTTTASGYPAAGDPFWYRYAPGFGPLAASQGGSGTATTIKPDAINHGFVTIAQAVSSTAFHYHGTRPERWAAAPELWLHGYWKYSWADLHVAVTKIDAASKTITLAQTPGYGLETGQPYYAENLLEEITVPGEWVLERASGVLYFWPPSAPGSGETIVSTLATPLVQLTSASYVTLQELTLEVSRAELIKIEGGAHSGVVGCVLRNAGTTAARVSGSDNGLSRCQIYGSGDGGVDLSGGSRASLTAGGNYVRNCDIHHFARWSSTYQPAVRLAGAGQIVAHNLIHDATHAAILFSGNEHTLEYNRIHHVCQFADDAGAIYTGRDWGYRGNVVRYNFIHDIASSLDSGAGVHGVYLDDCVSGIKVFGNVIYKVSGLGVHNGGGRDNLIENNVFARNGTAMSGDARGLTWINNTPGDDWNFLERLAAEGIKYQQPPWSTAYPKLAAIPSSWAQISDPAQLWRYPQGCVFSRNLGFANLSWMNENKSGGTGTFDKYAEIKDNVQDADPLFVDEASLNLALKPTSPALAIPGFTPIPFDKIGIEP